jgi:hypothetical protein
MVDVGPLELAPEELRVLGCLIEKEHTTPDQYPLTMNALVAACNQASNRSPVTAYDHGTVEAALSLLRRRGVARAVLAPGNRATKYRHVLDEAWGLTQGECAVLAVLALRGPQTVNELHARTERYSGLGDLGGVQAVLDRLAGRYEQPYVRRLGRQPGQREERWAHLLGGEPAVVPAGGVLPPSHLRSPAPSTGSGPPLTGPLGPSRPLTGPLGPGRSERMAALEQAVTDLREQLQALRDQVAELRDLL